VDRRAVHVGETFLEVDESRRPTTEPAPTRETVNAQELAAALRELQRDPGKAIAMLERLVADAKVATESVEKLVALAEDLANLADPAIAAKRAEPILARIAHDYRGGRFRDVVRLVWAVLAIYLVYEKWRALVALLHLDRLAADALGDSAEAARALSDLDVLADAAGVTPLAAGQAVEQAAEHAVADVSGQATQVAAHAGIGVGVKVAAAVVGAVVLAGAAIGITVAMRQATGGDDVEEVRPGGDAEIVAFAAGDDTDLLGSPSAGEIVVPEGAVRPEETLGACEPTYVYHYVQFENVADGTTYSGVITPGSGAAETVTKTWRGPADFVEGFRMRRGTEPLPYGEWVLAVEIEGDEVDRESFTLEEDC
jgi:hypothetical protein